MALVFGCIVPHPPLLVPAVGRGNEAAVSSTAAAMERLTHELSQSQPETLFIISPHGQAHYEAMGVLTAPDSRGDFRQWGVARGPEFHFDNDLEAVRLIQEECRAGGVPLRSIGTVGYDLDWGVTVPLYFLRQGLPSQVALVPLTFSWLSLETHYAFGRALRRAAERLNKRVALVASGDLSHRLLPEAPAGYDPMGRVFDEKLVELVDKMDVPGILSLDPELVARAGECGLRSIVILLGALEELKVAPKVHSYEGPFGVGYLVASFSVDESVNRPIVGGAHALLPKGKDRPRRRRRSLNAFPLVCLAKDTVESYLLRGQMRRPRPSPVLRERAGAFVSIKSRGELRGCIGTYQPTKNNLAQEVMANAIASAQDDPRFPPIEAWELPYLTYSVDVLTELESVPGPEALDPKHYGVLVERGRRRGLLLPDLEGVDSVEAQLAIACAKAGIFPGEDFDIYRFEVRRYYCDPEHCPQFGDCRGAEFKGQP